MKILLILSLLIILSSIPLYLLNKQFEEASLLKNPIYGVSFSEKYVKYLGFNPEEVLAAILYDLKVKNFRLIVYWDLIEDNQGEFNFTKLDKYIQQISDSRGTIIMAVGAKVPRWPECHIPEWATELTVEERRKYQLEMLKKVIQRYDSNPSIVAWQIENEPMMDFGQCPEGLVNDTQFLSEEVKFVKKLTRKPVVITDSGEVRTWVTPMKLSDILGISMYRVIKHPIFGQFFYPLPPIYYQIKYDLVNFLLAKQNHKAIIIELQAEAWLDNGAVDTPISEQVAAFPIEWFENNINYARKTGYQEIYLWGVEWWYFMKERNQGQYWQYAKQLF